MTAKHTQNANSKVYQEFFPPVDLPLDSYQLYIPSEEWNTFKFTSDEKNYRPSLWPWSIAHVALQHNHKVNKTMEDKIKLEAYVLFYDMKDDATTGTFFGWNVRNWPMSVFSLN